MPTPVPYASTLERWLADLANTGRSSRTLAAYRRDLDDTMATVAGMKGSGATAATDDELLRAFEDLDVAAITNNDLIAAVAEFRTRPDPRFSTNPHRAPEERSPATVARRVAALRTFFAWCYEHDLIAADPAAKLRTPKRRKRLPKALPDAAAMQALDEAGANARWPERDELIVALAIACGLRLDEIANLRVDHLQGEGPDHLVVRGKGDKERRLGVPPVVREALAAYLPTRQAHLDALGLDARTLVVSSRPRPVKDRRGETVATTVESSREAVAYVVDRLLRRLGVRQAHVRVHALRHTFATMGLKTGSLNLRQLQAALGHASLATTQLYTEVADDDLARAMAAHPLAARRTPPPAR
ncbi:MAG TPA: tyrosine-type recombinase/integrase [Acidimicrobiales bacterium]